MITVKEASAIINEHLCSFGSELVDFESALGRVLAEDLRADRDFPPFNRVMMDGIGIRHAALATQDTFNIQGLVAAGMPMQSLIANTDCLEVMTGAVMPEGADTVIRYEDLEITDGIARITIGLESIRLGQNIHVQGQDKRAGDLLVSKGKELRSAEIAVLATIGKSTVLVKKQPRILIISTGDELVDIAQDPLPHQIRKSNVHQMQSVLKSLGLSSDRLHLNDDLNEVVSKLETLIPDYDVLLMSGGVSKGKLDYIPEALERLDVKKAFHRVRQRPGKPFWFGYKDDLKVFALPGNPISTYFCMHKYFIPWLRASSGLQYRIEYAVLAADIFFKPQLDYFLEVALSSDKHGRLLASPQKGNGSGDLSNLTRAVGFMHLPIGEDSFTKGGVYEVIRFV